MNEQIIKNKIIAGLDPKLKHTTTTLSGKSLFDDPILIENGKYSITTPDFGNIEQYIPVEQDGGNAFESNTIMTDRDAVWFGKVENSFNSKRTLTLYIKDKNNGEYVGRVMIKFVREQLPEYKVIERDDGASVLTNLGDYIYDTAEITVRTNPLHRREGVMLAAIPMVLKHLEKYSVKCVFACIRKDNNPSLSLFKKKLKFKEFDDYNGRQFHDAKKELFFIWKTPNSFSLQGMIKDLMGRVSRFIE